MQIRNLVLAGAVLVCGSSMAQASMLEFIHEGEGAGTLNGVPFGPASFVISAVVDTNNRESFISGWFINHNSASIDIAGVGMFDFISGTRTFVNNNSSLVGFSRGGGGGSDLFNGPNDPAFGAWDMLTEIGPITGTGNLIQWGAGDIMTTGGVLIFDNAFGIPATFTAIPAPGTLALLGLAAVGLRRRR